MKTLNKFLYPALALTAIAYLIACQKLDFGTVTKSNIQNVTVRDASTVKVEMQIFDLSDDAHPDYGVCYSETNQLPTVADSKVAKGAPGTIKTDSLILQGLQPGSKIYIRAFVMNGSEPQYSFNVKDATLPQLPATTTLAATNITQTAANLNGIVNASNNTTTVIFEYGTTTAYGQTINATPNTVTGTTNTNVIASLAALQPNTSYHYRVKASCANGTSFGNDITFATTEVALPVVTTAGISNITTTGATTGGNVTGDGGSTVTARGVCWGISPSPTIADSHTTNGNGIGNWVSELVGLTPYTTYFLRAYATNSAGTAYGNELQFTTDVGQMPAVTTATITNITTTTAAGGGNVTDQGATPVTARGVCWSTSSSPTITESHTTDGTGTGSFTSNLTTLLPATTYYVRAYATNSAGTTYGNQVQFTTNSDQTPTVTTAEIINVTTTTATGGGNVTAQGTSPVTARGVCWSTSANPSVANSHTTNGSGTGNFVSDITGLTASTLYYVRAYATNATGTSYGNQVQFTTNSDQVPVVTTANITNITPTTATGGGNVTGQGTTPVTARGVCWSTSANPTITGSHTTNGSGLGNFTSDLTGLTPATLYFVRAYATNSAGTAYGNQVQFTTEAGFVPTVTTTIITNITTTTATGGGNVTAQGTTTVTARGVCWSTTQNPTITNSHTSDGTGTGSFTSNLAGLCPATIYYVRAYATNTAGTAYGSQVQFTTSAGQTPTVTTTNITNITTTTATGGGNVTAQGTTAVTARGVCWSTTQNPTITNSHTSNGTGTGVFTSNLTGLSPETIYYVRAYATNTAGTAYGNQVQFTSDAGSMPTVTTATITDITETTATGGGNVTAQGTTAVTARGVCWSTSTNPTIAGNHTTNSSGTGSFISNLTGLSPTTTYYVRAYATNTAGTAYGNQVNFTTLTAGFTCGSTITKNHVAGSVAPVTKTVTYSTVTNIPGETSKCWITSNLGSDHQATAVDDATEASAGWYWQFNRKQGYKHDGSTRTPNTTWISSISDYSDWTWANDPCTLLLGTGWRIPTRTEWTNVDASGNWTNWNGPWNSGLKLHAAGHLSFSDGSLLNRGSFGNYWSSTQSSATNGWYLAFYSGISAVNGNGKAYGFSLRCLRD